jgi:predicted ATPase/DNA-binding SARP family transcriptional activator
MARLVLSLLGPLQIALDNKPVQGLLWAKTQALLAYLAIESDRPHGREELAGLLWPDQPEEAARHSLRQALLQLKGVIGAETPPFLFVTPQTVQLNHASECSLDVAGFIAVMAERQAHPHRRLAVCRPCILRLQEAMALYGGDFLSGFFLKDSAPYEEWVLVKREQLARLALSALRDLAEHYALSGDYDMLDQVARREIDCDPYEEEAHRQLMRALSWGGRRDAALAHYEVLRRMLVADLDALPEKETVALRTQIEAQTLLAPQPSLRYNWPVHRQLTSFIGREKELANLSELLGAPRASLLTLLGPGGAGKTRLALQVAEQDGYSFRDGACWVSLDTVDAPDLVVPAIAAALRFSLSALSDALAQLCERLRASEMLLLLDGCEHCLGAALLVAKLAAACPLLKIMSTSRQPWHVRGERRFAVAPLSLPDLAGLPAGAGAPAALLQSPAVALFVDRAQAIRPDFALSEENGAAVGHICMRLDGLPLAIELAAVHIDDLSPQDILARLSNQLSFLSDGPRDLPGRQQTMRASIAWSHASLSPAEQLLMRRLGVFAGGCTLDAAEAVCAENGLHVPSGIESLLDRRLLQSLETGDGTRFAMYDSIREFALECLEHAGEAADVRRKHAQYYADWKDRHGQELNRLEMELPNLRAGMRWAIDSGQADSGFRIAGNVWFWSTRNAEWRYWFDELLRSPGAQLPSQARMGAVFNACIQAVLQEDHQRCLALRDDYLALATVLNDHVAQTNALYLSGYVCIGRQDYTGAASAFGEGLATIAGAGNRAMAAWFQHGLGASLLLLGDYGRAQACFQAALEAFAASAFRTGAIEAMTSLGYIALEQQDSRQGGELFRQAIAQAMAIGFHAGLPDCLSGMAGVAVQQNDLVRAARLYGAARGLADRYGFVSHEPSLVVFDSRHQAALRQRLQPSTLQGAWQEGRQMSMEEAVAYVS